MATVIAPKKLDVKEFKPEIPPDWCPGCGDFGVLNALFQACVEIDLPPRDLMVVTISELGFAETTDPSLTTLDLHQAELGERALALLADAVDGRPTTPVRDVATQLSPRDSTRR
jgi:DNA-binding LacI/PurR family transcriptional regulator